MKHKFIFWFGIALLTVGILLFCTAFLFVSQDFNDYLPYSQLITGLFIGGILGMLAGIACIVNGGDNE